MSDVDILVLVEGVTEKGAIKSIAKRLGAKIKVVLMRGNRIGKVRGVIRTLGSKYDKFIILKDLHKYPEKAIMERYNRIRRTISADLRERVKLVIVRHAIEAWFLADTDAVSRVFNCRWLRAIRDPESIEDPAEELNNMLKRKGKLYYKAENIAERIMREADLEVISKKASSFREFLNCLTDPPLIS
ncbi:hypothetical protein DRO37_01960 [Candidatus Bathyarchaeota archaeon]|nr:MAG: hypothetical protein DRO37_01960 [Candidatus Bathyarchaeota archaeon]